ncbi:MAG: sialidase family protein, partial [bacterium]
VYEDNGEIWYSKSSDEGATWSVEELVSEGPDKGNAFPSVTINQTDGNLYAVWQRDLGDGTYDIVFRKRTPSAWDAAVTVTTAASPPAGTLPQPVISIKRSGVGGFFKMRILVMYISSNNSLKYKYSSNEGSTWII